MLPFVSWWEELSNAIWPLTMAHCNLKAADSALLYQPNRSVGPPSLPSSLPSARLRELVFVSSQCLVLCETVAFRLRFNCDTQDVPWALFLAVIGIDSVSQQHQLVPIGRSQLNKRQTVLDVASSSLLLSFATLITTSLVMIRPFSLGRALPFKLK
jgi:hypothetical protein